MDLLVFDHRPSMLEQGTRGASLLTSPVAKGSMLDHLLLSLAGILGRNPSIMVVPTFPHDEVYAKSIKENIQGKIRLLSPDSLGEVIEEYEFSDYLLLADPSRWPASEFNPADALAGYDRYRAASHLVAVGAEAERTRERVESDQDGHVKRVHRLYDGVHWPEVANSGVFASVVPALAIRGIRFESLSDLRSSLSRNGVLSRDLPLPVDLIDLTDDDGLLELKELELNRLRTNGQGMYNDPRQGVIVDSTAKVHPSARLIGPLVVRERAQVGAGSTIMGPAVLGPGCRVGDGATIAHAVLTSGVSLEAGQTVRQQVVAGNDISGTQSVRRRTRLRRVAVRADSRQLRVHGGESLGRLGASSRPVHLAIKRLVDVVLSAVSLIVLSPLLVGTAILVKLESPGPIFFAHRRESKGGKEFACLKFRTMVADAHAKQKELIEQNQVDGPQFKIDSDPRVTRLGRWMRGTNIDELPQLINVFLGQMSLVGPRPSPFRENQICVPWRRARLSVRPGITGLWQICRSEDRSGGDFHEWIYYDIAYVRHFSIWLDMKIVAATLMTGGGRHSVPLSWLVRDPTGASGTTD